MSDAHMTAPFSGLSVDDREPSTMPVVYHLDADDRVWSINQAWKAFAAANAGQHLQAPNVVGRSLWDLLGDTEIHALYRVFLTRARAGAPVTLTLRCDAPARRRLLQLQLLGMSAGAVACICGVVAEAARPPVRLLDRTLPRRGGEISLCSWCARIEASSGTWVEIEAAMHVLDLGKVDPLPHLAYRTCLACARYLTVR